MQNAMSIQQKENVVYVNILFIYIRYARSQPHVYNENKIVDTIALSLFKISVHTSDAVRFRCISSNIIISHH